MSHVFEIKGLSKHFGGVQAVHNFSAYVDEGEIVGIIGPNGAGKTTILNLVSKIYTPDEGQVLLEGKDISKLRRWDIAEAGVARTFQNIRLFESLTAIENVMTILAATGKYKEEELRAKASSLMTEFGWTDGEDIDVRGLPYGKKRKLELIRAMALNPKFLMLDEPAAGLNPSEIQQLTAYIDRINKVHHIPIILIEHRLEVVMALCRRVYVVSFGETIAEGPTAEIWKNPVVVAAYLGEEAEDVTD